MYSLPFPPVTLSPTPKTPTRRPISLAVQSAAMAATFAFFSTALSPRRSPSLGGAPRLSQFTSTVGTPPDLNRFRDSGVPLPSKKIVLQATQDSINFFSSASLMSDLDTDDVPMPIVLIDQDVDPEATVVQVGFGDRLGALIDTVKALKDLGLNVVKGSVTTEGGVSQTKLHITILSSGRKVEDPDMLERIRLTVINNLLKYHPESSELLAMGEAFGIKPPEKKPDVDIATHIHIREDGPKRSLLCMETADRSGLLLEIMKIMADINLEVESAEIDTVGLVAKNKFHVSYHGAALNSEMSKVLTNCLRYYLRRPQTEDDSY